MQLMQLVLRVPADVLPVAFAFLRGRSAYT